MTDQGQHIVRWMFLFAGLIILFYITNKYKSVQYKNLYTVIVVICLIYYSFYLIQGLIAVYILGMGKWDSQSITWTGNAYAVLPLLVSIPCAISLFVNQKQKLAVVGYLMICLSTIFSFYFESRILLIILIAFGILSFFVIKWQKALILLSTVILIFVLLLGGVTLSRSLKHGSLDLGYVDGYTTLISDYANSLNLKKQLKTDNVTNIIRQSDSGRVIHIMAPIEAVKNNPVFGHGTYQSHNILKYHLERWGEYHDSEKVYTTGFGSYLTDYGWLGFGLLIINFICTGLILLLKRGKYWLFYGFALCIAFIWLFISNITDNMLWWLLICPYGILERLSYEKRDNRMVNTDSINLN